MMNPFDQPISRLGTWSEKYDARVTLFGRDDVIPMWVADMDFAAPDCVLAAVQARLSHPILGYTHIPITVAESVCAWQMRQHHWCVAPEQVVWLPGVVSGLYVAVDALTQVGDAVMVFTPVYPPFMRAVTDQNRQLVTVPLAQQARVGGAVYEIDYVLNWDNIEEAIQQHAVKLLLLSNPHNPSGRVWTAVELTRLAQLCLRYGVRVVSDEVWSDLLLDSSAKHTPFASLSPQISEQTITLNAPSKTFNLAAMHTAYAIISHADLRQQFVRVQQQRRTGEANVFGLHALQAAYSEAGSEWLTQVLDYLRGNIQHTAQRLAMCLPQITLMLPQASYLLWINGSAYFSQQQDQVDWWIREARLGLSNGTHFGHMGTGFMRMNVACSRQQLDQALTQIENAARQLV